MSKSNEIANEINLKCTTLIEPAVPIFDNIKQVLDNENLSNRDALSIKKALQAVFEKHTGIEDNTSLRLILDIIEALNKDNNERKVEVKPTPTELDLNNTLYFKNVDKCLLTIAQNKIPVLVGEAGFGKTYTARNLAGHIFEYKNKVGGNKYKSLELYEIDCSHISHNQFWGSFDAVSHKCIGAFQYVWNKALAYENIIHYVVLDELLDMIDIRETFGEGFSKLTSKPDNLVIVGTGNNGVSDIGRATYSSMLKDDGIRGRFTLIEIENILENIDSDEYNKFFSGLKPESEIGERLLKFIQVLDKSEHKNGKVLIPREVSNIVKGAYDKDYIQDIVNSGSDFYNKIFTDAKKSKKDDSDMIQKLTNILEGI